jgi:hypothetical protein
MKPKPLMSLTSVILPFPCWEKWVSTSDLVAVGSRSATSNHAGTPAADEILDNSVKPSHQRKRSPSKAAVRDAYQVGKDSPSIDGLKKLQQEAEPPWLLEGRFLVPGY